MTAHGANALTLRPYQEEGVSWLCDAHPYKFLADDMGLGKTPQAIIALNNLSVKTGVIVCPASVKIMWARRLSQWGDVKQVELIKNGKHTIPLTAGIIIVNYDLMIRPFIFKQLVEIGSSRGYDFVLFDESRALKELSTKRTKRALSKNSFTRFSRRIWLLDGTPVPNRPIELYPVLSTLAPDVIQPYNSYQAYGEYFCKGRKNIFGWDMTGHSNIPELSQRLKDSGFFLRRTKEEVMEDLPDKVETIIELDVPQPGTAADTPIATLRRDLAISKIPGARAHILDMAREVGKIVIFAYHRAVIEELYSYFGDKEAVKVYGGMTPSEKQAAIDRFISDSGCSFFIGQVVAGGSGIDGLQEVSSHVIFVEVDWSPGVMDQAIDRVRRIGQKKSTVFVQYLVVPDSLDTDMQEVLKHKRAVIIQLMDRKGVKMSIEQSLASIAASLEKLADKTSVDVLEKPKAKAKKAEEPLPPDPEIKVAVQQSQEPEAPTDLELAETIQGFLADSTGSEREARKDTIRDTMFKIAGTRVSKDVQPKHRAACIGALKETARDLDDTV